MRSNNQRYSGGKKNGAPKNVLNDLVRTAGGKSRGDAVINKIIYRFQSRTRIQIDTWRDAIAEAENGFYPKRNKWSKVVKDLDLDAHWTSQVQLRKLSVMRKPFKVVNKLTREEIPERTRLFQAPWFYELMNSALDAKFYGTQAVEIQDLLEGNQTWNAIYTVPMGYLKPEMREICLRDYALYGESHVDDPYVLWFDEDTFMGIMVKAAPYLIFKRNALQAWTEYCEKFGIPMRYATTNKKDTATLDKLEQMLDQLGRSARAIFPEGTSIDFKEANTQDAYLVFQELIKTCDDQVSKLVNGVTMLSDNGSSKSQSEVHERMFTNVIDSDAADYQSTVNWYIGPQLRKLGYAFNPDIEEWIWDDTEVLSKGALWNITQGVLKFYEVDDTWLTEKFGIPITGKRATPIPTSGNTDPAPANFNKPQPQPAAVRAFAIAEYRNRMASLNKGRTALPQNSITEIFTKAATAFFLNPNNKPDALKATEWTDLFKYVSEKFFAGAENGYGVKLTVELDTPDKEILENLRLNLYKFSAMKNYQLLQTLNANLRDENGNLREKADFIKLALEANNEYNVNWLETEYNAAVGKATGQARQKQFLAEAKDFDLMWQTVGDDRVRDSHAANDGLTVAADSDIAKSLVFPIDWGCRCEWVQIPIGSRKRTPDSKLNLPTPNDGMSNRIGEVFTSEHPYYKGVSNTDKTALENFAEDQIKKLSSND